MKKTVISAAVLLAIALFWAVPVFSGAIPSSVVPNGARWIVHLDVEKFVGTSLYGYLEKSGSFEIKNAKLNGLLKMDFPKDVTGVTVFGLGDDAKGQTVIAVAGKFDRPGIMGLIAQDQNHKEIPYGDNKIYSAGDNEFGAFVTDNLVVLADSQAAIEKALDTAASKGRNFTGSTLSASIKEIPAGAFLGGVLPDVPKWGKELGQSKMLENASGLFFLAQEKNENILLRVQLTADTAENAKNMADIVQGLVALGRMSGSQDTKMAQVLPLLDGLQVRQDGKVLKLEFERPSKEIADLLSRQSVHVKGLID